MLFPLVYVKNVYHQWKSKWSKHCDRNVHFTTNSLPPLKSDNTIAVNKFRLSNENDGNRSRDRNFNVDWLTPLHRVDNRFARSRMLNRWFQNLPVPACLNSSHAIKKLRFFNKSYLVYVYSIYLSVFTFYAAKFGQITRELYANFWIVFDIFPSPTELYWALRSK